MSSLITRSKVKEFALEAAKSRAHSFERVSSDFLDRAEGHLRRWVVEEVRRLPSKGKTIK